MGWVMGSVGRRAVCCVSEYSNTVFKKSTRDGADATFLYLTRDPKVTW
ncbi:hypothetical protein COLO4_18911 [Corchorus olitorius]|uniref:Uncharacterized protein n=1 Tax=Corchorus olitorius TaxID=93759 RepID=A0A1R3J7D4_9ROSI|nr:hypothetical protein COLO4_18911 [Corchorus olitorius]